MIVYKVCIIEDGKYLSAFTTTQDKRYSVKYKIGKTVEGKLFAFDTLQRARCFAIEDEAILKCKCIASKNQVSHVPTWLSDAVLFWRHYPEEWKNYPGCDLFIMNNILLQPVPPGTVLCDSVTPIQIIRDVHKNILN